MIRPIPFVDSSSSHCSVVVEFLSICVRVVTFLSAFVKYCSIAWRLFIAVQFGAMRNLHHWCSEYLCSGLIPNRSTFCIGSPFIADFCFFLLISEIPV